MVQNEGAEIGAYLKMCPLGGPRSKRSICPSFWCDSSARTTLLTHPCYSQAKLVEAEWFSYCQGAYGNHCVVMLR